MPILIYLGIFWNGDILSLFGLKLENFYGAPVNLEVLILLIFLTNRNRVVLLYYYFKFNDNLKKETLIFKKKLLTKD